MIDISVVQILLYKYYWYIHSWIFHTHFYWVYTLGVDWMIFTYIFTAKQFSKVCTWFYAPHINVPKQCTTAIRNLKCIKLTILSADKGVGQLGMSQDFVFNNSSSIFSGCSEKNFVQYTDKYQCYVCIGDNSIIFLFLNLFIFSFIFLNLISKQRNLHEDNIDIWWYSDNARVSNYFKCLIRNKNLSTNKGNESSKFKCKSVSVMGIRWSKIYLACCYIKS